MGVGGRAISKMEPSQSKRGEVKTHAVACVFDDNVMAFPLNKHHLSESLSNTTLFQLFLSFPVVQKLDSVEPNIGQPIREC